MHPNGATLISMTAFPAAKPKVLHHGRREEYPQRLNFYLKPPQMEISIEEFENFALDRMQVLKSLESATIRNKKDDELKAIYNEAQRNFLPLHLYPETSLEEYEERRKDHVSHFILRLAYCRSEELQEWFLKFECMLFKLRFEEEPSDKRRDFLQSLNLNWLPISTDLKEQFKSDLIWNSFDITPGKKWEQEDFFAVDFERVPDLVASRKVLVRDGKAYVPAKEQISLVVDEFRNWLQKELELTAKALPRMDDDERLLPVLNNINKNHLGKEYNFEGSKVAGHVTADDVDSLVQYFPPCMKNLHTHLRMNKHLKHYGRLQYGLFLKGIGMTLEEALVFWRKSFSNMTDDEFSKSYAYSIRHSYGTEGKRADYAPYNCVKIITSSSPSTDQHHGCPFRHFSRENLEILLHQYHIPPAQIREIMQLLEGDHYQIACTRLWEISRGTTFGKTLVAMDEKESGEKGVDRVTHPNQYFNAAFRAAKTAGEGSGNGAIKNEGTRMAVDR